MLRVDDIHTYYGDSYVLQGMSLTVGVQSIVALLGRNGMGKTTTIRSIMGMTPPRRGRVLLDDRPIQGMAPHLIARAGLAIVPQGRRIFPSLSVEENLLVGRRSVAGAAGAWDLGRIFDTFRVLGERRRQPGALLSGGEQQLLAIGRALMTNPRLIVLDEPSEGLSPTAIRAVMRVIADLKNQGLSILLVEQNVPAAVGVSDHVYVVSKGRVVYEGTPEALTQDEAVIGSHLGVSA
jgi:branched-chain amino acid transport system ATP-binding protein